MSKCIKYLDPNTRVNFGFHFSSLGYSYKLQRRVKFLFGHRWKSVAWTYGLFYDDERGILDYLFWYEKMHPPESEHVLKR